MPLLAMRIVAPLAPALTPFALNAISEFSTLIVALLAEASKPSLVFDTTDERLMWPNELVPTVIPVTMPANRTLSSTAVANPGATTDTLIPVLHSTIFVS